MENNKKTDHADDNLQIRLSVKPRFKAGAELPTSVNITIGEANDRNPNGPDRVSLSIDMSV